MEELFPFLQVQSAAWPREGAEDFWLRGLLLLPVSTLRPPHLLTENSQVTQDLKWESNNETHQKLNVSDVGSGDGGVEMGGPGRQVSFFWLVLRELMEILGFSK